MLAGYVYYSVARVLRKTWTPEGGLDCRDTQYTSRGCVLAPLAVSITGEGRVGEGSEERMKKLYSYMYIYIHIIHTHIVVLIIKPLRNDGGRQIKLAHTRKPVKMWGGVMSTIFVWNTRCSMVFVWLSNCFGLFAWYNILEVFGWSFIVKA